MIPRLAAGDLSVSSIFAPVSAPAEAVQEVAALVLSITGAIFVIVAGLLIFAIVRYRRRPGDPQGEPPQIYGSGRIELAWTVIPLLAVTVLFLSTTRTIFAVQGAALPDDSLRVEVIGHQWWWEFHYPELGVTTANELHVPVSNRNDRRPTRLDLESQDVVHSFWVPQLAGKTDLIPNHENRMWIEPFETGEYLGQCAEYCGVQHAHMLLRVFVHSSEDFDRWVAEQQRPAVRDASVADGRRVFMDTACINCHTIRGEAEGIADGVADGRFGPDLTHLMSRATIGAGAAENTPENLRDWVNDPEHLKPGVLMPPMKLDRRRLDRLVAYLTSLR